MSPATAPADTTTVLLGLTFGIPTLLAVVGALMGLNHMIENYFLKRKKSAA